MASNQQQTDIRDFMKDVKSDKKATGKANKNKKTPPPKQQQQAKTDPKLAAQLLSKISIHRGSITDLKVDCIVNAANGGLWAGAGVCGAIFRAAGYSSLTKECDDIIDKYGNIPTGQSVVTKGYKLYAKNIIHSVGPTSQNKKALKSCYTTALDVCIKNNIKSIAFPCTSTGIFGFDKQLAAPLALNTVCTWLINAKNIKYNDFITQGKKKKDEDDNKENKQEEKDVNNDENEETLFDRIEHIIFCCFDIGNWRIYEDTVSQIFPSVDDNYSYLWTDKLKDANKKTAKCDNTEDNMELVDSEGSDNDD